MANSFFLVVDGYFWGNKESNIYTNKIILPTDTKINKYLNNFYNTGLAAFDYIQKEETSFI